MTRAARIKSQIGFELSPIDLTTPVAPTVQLPGLLTMRHAPERVLREEYRNSWGGSNTHDDLKLESTGQYVGRCTASTLVYWLNCAMRNDPTLTGSGPYTRLYQQPLSVSGPPAVSALRAFSGDDEGGPLIYPGVVVTRLVIEGGDTAAWTVRADLLGMGSLGAGTFATLNTITNESVKNLLTRLYLSASWTALLATTDTDGDADLVKNFSYGFTWTWDSGITGDYTMGRSLNRSDINRGIPNVTLQLRVKYNNVAAAQAVQTINNSRRFIRLMNVGTANSKIIIDGSYDPMTFDTITDQRDGTTRGTWDLVGVEDPGGGTPRKCEVTVVNALATL